jgi:4-hydroxybenzoate polyprenyltransferase
METSAIIIAILWSAMSMLVMIEYAPYCKDLSLQDQLIVGLIFVIGGPIFTIANVLEAILDCILPEGWGDDDGPKGY